MFERYTETAKRVIFFARYEASQLGADYIDPSHLLLALLQEDEHLFEMLLGSPHPFENPMGALGLTQTGEKVGTSVDLPLSAEAKRVLMFAAEEPEEHITPGHLLLGLMKEPCIAGDLLRRNGLDSTRIRAALAGMSPSPGTNAQIVDKLREQFGKLTLGLKPEMEPAVVYRLNK